MGGAGDEGFDGEDTEIKLTFVRSGFVFRRVLPSLDDYKMKEGFVQEP